MRSLSTFRMMIGFLLVVATAAISNEHPTPPATRPTVKHSPADDRGNLFDDTDRARRMVFALDASGSMISKMASLKDQLTKTIDRLAPEQSFNLIFFQDNKYDLPSKELASATIENKKKAGVFLEGITTTGTTDPIPGIEAAFKQKPQAIYLLTDGDFPDNDAVLQRIRKLNQDKKVRVYTIAFVDERDSDTAFLALLKTIANENGGKFKHVKLADVP